MTKTLPLRRTTRHLAHLTFTDAETFISLSEFLSNRYSINTPTGSSFFEPASI
jgi:hypothetical protein